MGLQYTVTSCFVSGNIICGKIGLRAMVPGFRSQLCHLKVYESFLNCSQLSFLVKWGELYVSGGVVEIT